jgi:GUN4-like
MAPRNTFVMLLLIISAACLISTEAFNMYRSVAQRNLACRRYVATELASTPAETSSAADTEIPTYLPSEMGVDYIPLATMLATGDFEAADQFTRDALIKIGGPGAVKRNFVYWTEVKNLPSTDLATMERLWLQFSDGNFGYSVQQRVWTVEKGNFDNFIRRIGWTKVENGVERKLKWFGKSEFIYDVAKAPKGHLPLTSALRGTQLMKELMNHPVWTKYDWKNYKDLKWGP